MESGVSIGMALIPQQVLDANNLVTKKIVFQLEKIVTIE
jgi:hypothetical protein